MIRKHLPAVLLCGLLTALALPAILLDIRVDSGVAADSVQVHVPQMNLFVAAPVAPLDHKAHVASIPLYHMAFAAAARAMGIGTIEHGMIGLRLLNGGLGLLLVLCAVRLLGRTDDPLRPLLLLLPPPNNKSSSFSSIFAKASRALRLASDNSACFAAVISDWVGPLSTGAGAGAFFVAEALCPKETTSPRSLW